LSMRYSVIGPDNFMGSNRGPPVTLVPETVTMTRCADDDVNRITGGSSDQKRLRPDMSGLIIIVPPFGDSETRNSTRAVVPTNT